MNQQLYGEGASRAEQAVFTLGMAVLLFGMGMALGGIYVYGAMLAKCGMGL